MPKVFQLILLLSIAVRLTISLDPVVCSRGCKEGFLINQDCSCTQGKMCIALACPGLNEVTDFRSCACVAKKDLLPYKPVICKDVKCPLGSKLSRKCRCEPPLDPGAPLPMPVFPGGECLIARCDHRFRLDRGSCSCKPLVGPTCRKGYPRGMRIYAKPQGVGCKCEVPPKCQIQSCAANARLKNCMCVQKMQSSQPECGIRRCKSMFRFIRSRCFCLPRKQVNPECGKSCPRGQTFRKGSCKCKRNPKCSIKSCKGRYRLQQRTCKCVAK